MNLKDILNGLEFKTEADISAVNVANVTDDSRMVRPGDLFIALSGYSVDGHKFINDCVARGARVVLSERDFHSPPGITKVIIRDLRRAIPVIANNFYNDPSRELKLVGVTGTNGKTTITYLLEKIWKTAGKETGVIGTVNYRFKDKLINAGNTTPGPIKLTGLLRTMVEEGIGYVVMEVSSHSLSQQRVDGLSFDAAIFTNITSEHMDYHRTIENYFDAKSKIFDRLKINGTAVLNNDDAKVTSLKDKIKREIITYGLKNGADVAAKVLKLSLDGSKFIVTTPKGSVELATKLIGLHNISNILASVAASMSQGIDLARIKDGIESLRSVPGRLEGVDSGQPFKVFVDYAHTEDALYNMLSVIREVAPRRMITVFGCGGNRDRSKRPMMGKVACRFSDKVIVTSDNPRFEKPQSILREIEDGVKGEFSNYTIIEDRKKAIEAAIEFAAAEDVVIIAGKGHERYQILGEEMIPFDDCEVAKAVLEKQGYAGKRDFKYNEGEISIRKP